MNEYTMDSIEVGSSTSFTRQITIEMQNMFTEVSGDINPLHLDSSFARNQGFADKVVYGMLSASLYSTLVGVHLPGKYCLFHECSAQFTKPVYVGDILTVFGEVKDIDRVFNRVVIKAYIRNQQGEKVSRAKLTVGLIEAESVCKPT